MSNCVCCGSTVPEEQRICSMCYGDPSHGTDGYYERWIEEQQQEKEERENKENLDHSEIWRTNDYHKM